MTPNIVGKKASSGMRPSLVSKTGKALSSEDVLYDVKSPVSLSGHSLCLWSGILGYKILLGAGLGLYLCPLSQSALGITAALFSRPIDSRPVVQNDKETKADSNEK